VYYQYFGLTGPPFSAALSSTAVFLGPGHREALAALEWGLREPSGFTLVVGEPGTGKTTLILSLLARQFEGVRAAWVADPKLSFEEMLRVIAAQLGLRPLGMGRFELLQSLDVFLAGLKPKETLALIFDEVQGLSDELLEELRLLRNLRSAGNRRLQIILVGHLDFVRRLAQPQLSQLNQRIGARTLLPVLKAKEIRAYLECRLHAHRGNVNELFTAGAVRELVRNCGGVPRKINLFCDNALLFAYAQQARKVSFKHMKVAVRDYNNLLWATEGPSLLSGKRGLSRIIHSQSLRFASVCALVLFALAISYRLNPATFGALLPSLHKGIAPSHAGHTNALQTAISGSPRDRDDKTARDARSEASDEGAPAKAQAKVEGSGSADSPSDLVADKVPAPTSPASAPTSEPELTPPLQPVPAAEKTSAADLTDDPAETALSMVVVKKGDSFSKITSRLFGSGRPDQVQNLAQANPQITDINRIYPGQIIYVEKPLKTDQQ
jgi:type II secretory pathway predicted ATPase ExeA